MNKTLWTYTSHKTLNDNDLFVLSININDNGRFSIMIPLKM